MKVRSLLTGKEFQAEWRVDHPASSYGQPICVLKETGQAIDLFCFSIIEDEGRDDFSEFS